MGREGKMEVKMPWKGASQRSRGRRQLQREERRRKRELTPNFAKKKMKRKIVYFNVFYRKYTERNKKERQIK